MSGPPPGRSGNATVGQPAGTRGPASHGAIAHASPAHNQAKKITDISRTTDTKPLQALANTHPNTRAAPGTATRSVPPAPPAQNHLSVPCWQPHPPITTTYMRLRARLAPESADHAATTSVVRVPPDALHLAAGLRCCQSSLRSRVARDPAPLPSCREAPHRGMRVSPASSPEDLQSRQGRHRVIGTRWCCGHGISLMMRS